MLKKELQKRFWVYFSPEYEDTAGLHDFEDSRSTLEAAKKLTERWGETITIFDSHSGKTHSRWKGEWSTEQTL